jgi:MFS transporter, FHS family, glucose/mannose:H+ symporter
MGSLIQKVRGLAQSGSAFGLGPKGRGFKSLVPDQEKPLLKAVFSFSVNPSLTLVVVLATYAMMVSIGAINASYGAVLPFLEANLAVSSGVIGLLGTAQTVGGVLGNLSTVVLEKRLSAGQQMWLGGTGLALGSFGLGLALFGKLGFVVALLALFVLGLGLGLLQVNYANLFSKGFGERSGAVMSVMSTAFAVGSIVGPLLAVWLQNQYAWLPVAFGLLTLGCAGLVRRAIGLAPSTQTKTGSLTFETWLFGLMIGLYVVAEQGAGFWGITHLRYLGMSETASAGVFSLFWLLILLGRLAGAALAVRFSSQLILLVSSFGAALALFVANVAPVAAVAYLLSGVLLAPIFPLGLTWLAKHNPSSLATTVYLVSGSLGAAIGIPLVGFFKDGFGDAIIPITLGVAQGLAALLVLWLWRQTR